MSESTRVDVLIVEDDEDLRSLEMTILEDAGYRVAGVADGAAALAYLQCQPLPQLMLLDLSLPVMNGLEVLAAKMANTEWDAMPVILMSGSSDTMALTGPLASVSRLTKPFQIDVLLDAVGQHIVQEVS